MATILIVDDRPANREFLVALLGYGGHRLLEAADGAEGLAVTRDERPDLVIADLLMPTMDGYEFVRQLRADPLVAGTRVIFFTAHYLEPETRKLAADCGVLEVLTKPCEPDVVLRAVDAALGDAPLPTPAPAAEFDREHLQVLTDKLSQKVDEHRRTMERLAAMVDLGLQLGAERDPARLLRVFCDSAREIVGSRYAIVGVPNGGDAGYRHFLTSGIDVATSARIGRPDPLSGLLGSVLAGGQSFRAATQGGLAAAGFPPAFPPATALLAVPILSPARVHGWICLLDKLGASAFTEEEERLARMLGAQVGRMYENGSLYGDLLRHSTHLAEEVSERKRTEQALAERVRLASLSGDIGLAVTHGESLRDMLRRSAEALVRHLNGALARVWTLSDDGRALELQATAGSSGPVGGSHDRVAVGDPGVGVVAQERRPYVTNTVDGDPGVCDPEWARREGVVAFAGYPLLVGRRLVGVVALLAREPLRPATIEGLAPVADQIALGIDRKRAESALRASEERFRAFMDNSPAIAWIVDEEGRVVYLSRNCRGALRVPADLVGKPIRGPSEGDADAALPPPTSPARIEPAVRSDGSTGQFLVYRFLLPGAGGPRQTGGVAIDVTEQTRTEEALRQAQQRLEHVLTSSPAILFTLSMAEGRIRGPSWISDNLPEILGYTLEEAHGAEWWLANIHPDDRDRTVAQTQADLLAVGRVSQEYRFRHRDGTWRWTHGDLRAIRDAAGEIIEAVGSWTDITERKHLEDQFRQAQKMEAVGRLAGGVAHDFNNLLTVINGYGELVLEQLGEGSPARKMVREIVSAGERAAALTRQLLAFSRKAILEPRVMDLRHVVSEMERMLGRMVGEDIDLTILVDRDPCRINADLGQVQQVLMNLVVNARDAMPKGGQLTVEVRNTELDVTYTRNYPGVRPGPFVLLAVTDTGCGMDAAVIGRIFEPFFTTKGEHGTGLGLATVHGIVKQGAGHIAVYSEVGRGTVFKVYWPSVERSDPVSGDARDAGDLPRGGETVLLAEDENGVRALASHVLRECGYTVLEADTGTEAIRLATLQPARIQLLITDVVMPQMGGREVAEAVRKTHPGIKVLYLSGYTDDALVRHGVLQAEVAFLQKPFTPSALAAKVRGVLDGAEGMG